MFEKLTNRLMHQPEAISRNTGIWCKHYLELWHGCLNNARQRSSTKLAHRLFKTIIFIYQCRCWLSAIDSFLSAVLQHVEVKRSQVLKTAACNVETKLTCVSPSNSST